MVASSTSQRLYKCRSSSSAIGCKDPSLPLSTSNHEPMTQTMTLLIRTGSLRRHHRHLATKYLTIVAPEASTVKQLLTNIQSLLGIPYPLKAQLLHGGRALPSQSTAASLKAVGLISYDILTLACAELLGGSSGIKSFSGLSKKADDDTDPVKDPEPVQDFNFPEDCQGQNSIMQSSILETNFAKSISIGFGREDSLTRKSATDINDKDDSVTDVLLVPDITSSEAKLQFSASNEALPSDQKSVKQPEIISQASFDQDNTMILRRQDTIKETFNYVMSEGDGLLYEWANVKIYATEMQKNSTNEISELEQIEKSMSQAQEQLIEKYGIPKVNVALENIAEIIPDLKKKIGAELEKSEVKFNEDILDWYTKFDVSKKGYLLYDEFLAYLQYICNKYTISIDQKTVHLFAKAIDKSGDQRYSKGEIFRFYSKEERNDWFALKRKEVEDRWNAEKEAQQKQKKEMEEKANAKQQRLLILNAINYAQSNAKSNAKFNAKSNEDEHNCESVDHSGSKSINYLDHHENAQESLSIQKLSQFDQFQQFRHSTEKRVNEQVESYEYHFYGESCFALLFRLKNEQDESIKVFSEKLQANETIRNYLNSIMDGISKTETWYGKISKVQTNLLKAILYEALENDRLEYQSDMNWQIIVDTCDLNCLIEIILCLGPDKFRDSHIEYKDKGILKLIGLLESTKNERLISMLLESIESSQERKEISEVFASLNQYFLQANEAQQRMILSLTCNQGIKAEWTELLEPKKILKLLTPQQESEQFNFAQLALCSHDKLQALNEMMSPEQNKQWSAWQLVNALGFPKPSFESLESQNQELVRTIKLTSDTKCLFQLPHESIVGQFYRVEQHSRQHDAVFKHSEINDCVELVKNEETSYSITLLKYSQISKRIEPLRQLETDQPIAIENGSPFLFTRPLLFNGEGGRVFWFTKATDRNEFRINILNDQFVYENYAIPEGSQLYTYLSLGNKIVEENGETAMFPMAEPNLITMKGRLYLAYSYFNLGMLPSVVIYGLEKKKDLILFHGASLFVQKHHAQSNQSDEYSNSIHGSTCFTLMFVTKFCKKKQIETEKHMKFVLEQCEQGDLVFINVQASHHWLNKSSMKVIEIEQEAERIQKQYAKLSKEEAEKFFKEQSPSNLITLVISDSVLSLGDWLTFGGQYKILKHTGPNDEEYLVLQNSEQRAKQCLVYEVQSRDKFKLKFNFRQDSRDVEDTLFQFVRSEPRSKPLLLSINHDENSVCLYDMIRDYSKESDREENESESRSDDEAEDLIFSKSSIPDSIQTDEQGVNLYSLPSLVNDAIIYSVLNTEKKYFDVSIRRKPHDEDEDKIKIRRRRTQRYDHNQVQRSYHESEDDEASQELFGVALLNQFDNNPHAWKFSSSYPLIAGVNTEIAGGMIVASMANGVEEQILLKLDLGQFISFVDQEKVDTNTNISFLSFSNDLQSLKLCTLSFKEIHKKRVILNHKNWKSETKILNEEKSFCKLYETRDKIQRIRLYKQNGTIALLCQTDQDIFFITEKGSITQVFTTKGDFSLANVNMIQSQNGLSYFIIEELSSQTNFIYEFSFSIEKDTEKFVPSFDKVYTFSMGSVIEVQLHRDSEQLCSNDYTHEGKIQSKKTSSGCALMVIANNNFIKLSQKKSGALFEEIECRSLTKESGLMSMLQNKTPEDKFIMSDRTFIQKDQVFAISSGRTHNALEGYLSVESKVLASQLVPGSDKVMYTIQSDRNLYLAFKRDPGRKNFNPIGLDGLRDCLSANFISKDLILFQIRINESYPQEIQNRTHFQGTKLKRQMKRKRTEVRNYWTYVTVDEQIKELSPYVADQLNEKSWTKVESRIVRGSVCQLLLFYQKPKLDDNQDVCKEKDRESLAKLVKLTSDGELLTVKDITIYETECDEIDLIQNQAGQLLQVNVFYDGSEPAQETAYMIPEKQESDGNATFPQQILIKECTQGIQYAYTGDYFCWIQPGGNIKAIELTKTQRIPQAKEIKLCDGFEKSSKTSNFVTISPSMPYSIIRMSQESILDEKLVKKYSNFVQMTTNNHALLYNLNDKDPKPEHEMAALQQLQEPQNFVDPGMTIETSEQKSSEQWEVEEFKLIQGNHPFRVKTWLEPWQKGGTIIMKQKSNLSQSKAHPTDIKFRPVVGFFREYCEADLMEVRSLKNDAENGIKPKRIDIKALWALYGDTIFLSLLLGNLRILTAINDYLGSLELVNCEENDGTETYHPDLQRLGDILMKKTYTATEKSDDHQTVHIESFLQKELKNSGLRDAILKIGRQCPSFSVLKLFVQQKDFQTMIERSTAQTTIELENCFSETRSTRQIQLLDWPRDKNFLTLRSEKCTITKQELNQKLEGQKNRITRTVKVSTTDLRWFYRDRKNFISFTQMLQNLPNTVYTSIFVESLLDLFWDDTKKKIIKYKFAPYLLLVLMTLWFFVSALSERNDQVKGSNVTPQWLIYLQASLVSILWLNQVKSEVKQIFALENMRDYFKNPWNVNDFISLSLTLVIVVLSVQEQAYLSPEILRQLAAIASCALLLKVYDWLKLFDRTAFYILLLDETMRDVGSFLILLFTALLMFGMPMIMLNLNSFGDNKIVDDPFDYIALNMLLNQYLLALGEFNFDNFAVHPQTGLCFFFFVMATFVTQIAMLNMMIAIMADTFERVIENRIVNATKMKLDLMSDMFATLSHTSKKDENQVFMFRVHPDDDQTEEGDDWEGSINKITRLTSNNINQLGKQIHKKTDKIQDSLNDFMHKDQIQDKHLKAHIDKIIKSSQRDINQKMNEQTKEMKLFMSNLINQKLVEKNPGSQLKAKQSGNALLHLTHLKQKVHSIRKESKNELRKESKNERR